MNKTETLQCPLIQNRKNDLLRPNNNQPFQRKGTNKNNGRQKRPIFLCFYGKIGLKTSETQKVRPKTNTTSLQFSTLNNLICNIQKKRYIFYKN